MDYFRSSLEDQKLDEASSRLVLQMARIWGDYIGDPIEKQSLKYLWLEECIDGGIYSQHVRHTATLTALENLFVANTYGPILDHITKSALKETELHLSTKVTKVASNTKLDADHPYRVAVSTNTKDTPLHYDEVVVTAPLGYLKRNLSIFSPPLPNNLTRAIDHISYGRLEKVYITFPTAYWTKTQPTATKSSFFTNFLHPTYANSQNPSSWSLECVSLAALPTSCAHPTLLFYVHGPCATHVTSPNQQPPPNRPSILRPPQRLLRALLLPPPSLLRHLGHLHPGRVPSDELAERRVCGIWLV